MKNIIKIIKIIYEITYKNTFKTVYDLKASLNKYVWNISNLQYTSCSILVSGFTYCHVNSYVTKSDTRDLLRPLDFKYKCVINALHRNCSSIKDFFIIRKTDFGINIFVNRHCTSAMFSVNKISRGGYFGVKRIGMTVGNPRKLP